MGERHPQQLQGLDSLKVDSCHWSNRSQVWSIKDHTCQCGGCRPIHLWLRQKGRGEACERAGTNSLAWAAGRPVDRANREYRRSDILRGMVPSELLKLVRRRQGLTQADLARRAGTSQPVISAYEHGRRDPSYETLRKLVDAAGERLELEAVIAKSDLTPPSGPAEHARRLIDVLSLADAIPVRRRSPILHAPRLVSR